MKIVRAGVLASFFLLVIVSLYLPGAVAFTWNGSVPYETLIWPAYRLNNSAYTSMYYSQQVGSGWDAPMMLYDSDASNSQYSVAAGANSKNDIQYVFYRLSDAKIYWYKTALSTATSDYIEKRRPVMAVSDDDMYAVAWSELQGANWNVHYTDSYYPASCMPTPNSVKSIDEAADHGYLDIAFSKYGNPFIAYYRSGSMYVSRFINRVSWNTASLGSISDGEIYRPNIETSDNGTTSVVWASGTTIYYSTWTGSAWTSASTVTSTGNSPRLAFDINNTPFVAYFNTGDSRVHVARFNVTWRDLTAGNATANSLANQTVKIAVDNIGYPAIVWEQYNANNYWNTYYARWNGTGWANRTAIDSENVNQGSPQLVFDYNNAPVVAYGRDTPDPRVSVSKLSGNAWSRTMTSNMNSPHLTDPRYAPVLLSNQNTVIKVLNETGATVNRTTLVTVYAAGTSNVVCQGYTNFGGLKKCTLNADATYDIRVGNYGAWLYSFSPPGSVTLVAYSSPVAISGLNMTFTSASNKRVTVVKNASYLYNPKVYEESYVPFHQYSPSLVVDSNNTPFIAYRSQGNNADFTLRVARSNGTTWDQFALNNNTVMYTSGDASYYYSPRIALDRNNNTRGAVWSAYYFNLTAQATYYAIFYSEWNGAAWSQGVMVNPPRDNQQYSPELVYDYNNRPFISYFDVAAGKILATRWNGSIWITDTVSNTSSSYGWDQYARMAVNSTGNPAIVWGQVDSTATYWQIWYAKWNGTGWGPISHVSTAEANHAYSPSLAFDGAGNAYVSYYRVADNKIHVARLSAGAWTDYTVATLTSTNSADESGTLSTDRAGTVWISYPQYNAANYWTIYYSKWSGAAWDTAVAILDDGSNHQYSASQLVFDSNNIPYISFYRTVSAKVYAARLVEGGWQGKDLSTTSSSNGWYYKPRMTTEPMGGAPVAAWNQYSMNGYWSITYSRWDGATWGNASFSAAGSQTLCEANTNSNGTIRCGLDSSRAYYDVGIDDYYGRRHSGVVRSQSTGDVTLTAQDIMFIPAKGYTLTAGYTYPGGDLSGTEIVVYENGTSTVACTGLTNRTGTLRCFLNASKAYDARVEGLDGLTKGITVSSATLPITLRPMMVNVTTSAGVPVDSTPVMVYLSGTSTTACEGNTTSASGIFSCAVIDSGSAFDIRAGSYGAWYYGITLPDYFQVLSAVPRQPSDYSLSVRLVNYSSSLTTGNLQVTVKNYAGVVMGGAKVTIFDADTSIVACSGTTSNGTGVMACGLNSSRRYDIRVGETGPWIYNRSVPDNVILSMLRDVGYAFSSTYIYYGNLNGTYAAVSPGTDYSPSVVFDSYNNFFIAYWHNDNYDYVRIRYNNGSWGAATAISADTTTNGHDKLYSPRLAAGANGYVGVVWSEGATWNIYYRQWENGGWSAKERIAKGFANGVYSQYHPVVALNSNNTAFAAYFVASENRIYSAVRTGTDSWANYPIGTAYSDTNFYSMPKIAIDNNGYAAVVWAQYNPTYGSIWNIYYSKWNGIEWSVAQPVYARNFNQFSPAIIFDNNNMPVVAWIDGYSVHATKWNGAAWQDYTVSTGVMMGTNSWEYIPRISEDGNGYPALVWGESDKSTFGMYRTYYSRWDGSAWSTPEKITYTSAYHNYAPELVFDPSGNPIITTHDHAMIGANSSWVAEAMAAGTTTWPYTPRIASKPVAYDYLNVTVIDNGAPTSGASVAIYDSEWPATPICAGSTDASGRLSCGLNKYVKTYNIYVSGSLVYSNITVPNSIVTTSVPTAFFSLQDPSGSPVAGQQITAYESGTSTIGCQGPTNSTGQFSCGLNSSRTYDAYMGTNTAGTLFYVAKPGGQMRTINDTAYTGWLNITLRKPASDAVADQQISVYESGTSTVWCQGKTSYQGQFKCSIDANRSYEVYMGTNTAGTLFYVAKPGGQIRTGVPFISTGWLNVTLRDSSGNAVPDQQVTAYVTAMSWSTDTMDSDANSDTGYTWSYAPHISRAPNGNVGVVWVESDGTYWKVRYREWSGSSWSDHGNYYRIRDAAEHQYSPQIAFDSNSRPFIAYYASTSDAIVVTRWDGSSWTTDTLASNANGGDRAETDAYSPRIAAAPNGNIGVVWGDYRTGESYYNIRYAEWNGTGWTGYTSNQKIFEQTASHQYYPQIAFDSSSRPFVAYYTVTDDAIRVTRWTGSAWTTAMMDSDLNSNTEYTWVYVPRISRAPNGNVGVVWVESDGTYWQVRYREWSGSSWSDTGNYYQIRDAAEHQYSPQIAFDSNSRPFIAYYASTSDAIVVTRWDGSSWTTDTLASNANGGDRAETDAYSPRIAAAPNGNIGVVWGDYRTGEPGGYWNIRYADWNGTAWANYSNNQRIFAQTSMQQYYPEIAFDSNSKAFVSYYTSDSDAIRVSNNAQQIACQGNTGSAGQLKCALDSTKTYDVQTGYGTHIFNISISNAVDMLRYSSSTSLGTLTVALLDSYGGAASGGQVSVYEAGTSTLACQGTTNSAGQLKCALDSTKTYDVQTAYGAHAYGTGAANTITLRRYSASTVLGSINLTLKDSAGNAVANQQVIIYEAGTTLVACSGNANSAGQLKCSLDKGKSYDLRVPYMQKNITNVNVPYSAVITSEIKAASEVQATLLSLSGTVKYLNNSLVGGGSFRIELKDSLGTGVWGPYAFNNTIVNGEFGIVLGGQNILQLTPYARYRAEIAFCDIPAFDETAGACVSGTSHYDLFTTYFKG